VSKATAQAVTVTMAATNDQFLTMIPAVNKSTAQPLGIVLPGNQTITLQPAS
jgi:hypothetical protein